MKEKFLGFYSLDEGELGSIWRDKNTLFIFDTNCLLNLYRCEEKTQNDIFSVMEIISERIWIPFQVGLEYQRNRKEVISDGLSSLNDFINSLQEIPSAVLKSFSKNKFKKNLYQPLSNELEILKEKIESSISDYIESNIRVRVQHKTKICENDFIRARIDGIIKNKVGEPFTQDEINDFNKEGECRYLNNVPPGFHDAKDKKGKFFTFSNVIYKNEFGDLYLWKEIIKKAKDESVDNVIFICDDFKPDWWFILNGKTHGALEALTTEILTESNIKKFKMISQSTFLYEARKYLHDVKLEESSLKEVKQLHNSYIKENQFVDYSIMDPISGLEGYSEIDLDSDYYFYEIEMKRKNLMGKLSGLIFSLRTLKKSLTVIYNDALERKKQSESEKIASYLKEINSKIEQLVSLVDIFNNDDFDVNLTQYTDYISYIESDVHNLVNKVKVII